MRPLETVGKTLWRHWPAALTWLGRAAWLVVLLPALALLSWLAWHGLPTLGAELFFDGVPAWDALRGAKPVWNGIWPACAGTLCLVAASVGLALFPGVGGGVFLAEYANPCQRRWLGGAVEMLAGVPSIVMGLFGFTLIVLLRRTLFPSANSCLILSALCLSLLVLPSLVVATREALLAVPRDVRLAAAALGLTPAERVWHVLAPAAGQGILGGVFLAVGRAAEDTSVILLTGVVSNAGLPAGPTAKFEALPFVVFTTAAQYQGWDELARGLGAALVLLALSGGMLAVASVLAERHRRRWRGDAAARR